MQALATLTNIAIVEGKGPGWTLVRVFEVLDRAGIRYCVLHGYQGFPHKLGSDVDIIIEPSFPATELYDLLHRNSLHIGAEMVICRGYYIVLAGKHSDGSHFLLTLDFSPNCELEGVPLYDGKEVLANRQRHTTFWIPSVGVEFGYYLAKSVVKGTLDDARTALLSGLYQLDAAACIEQVTRFWSPSNAHVIVAAARSGDWRVVLQKRGALRKELRAQAIRRRPGQFIANKFHAFVRRFESARRPNGLNIAFLGPDGAGKSSVIDAVGPRLLGAFARTACSGFAPPLRRLLRRGARRTDQPHALPSRSVLTSLLRAGYWLVYYTAGHLPLRWAVARSTLVLNDRHFVDILVDTKRYRYGAPAGVLQLIWYVIPKPDMVILLDAPPEVLQSRKQEVPFDETVRQRNAYLALTQRLPNGYVVDAAQPRERVATDVSNLVLQYLATRLEHRLHLQKIDDTTNLLSSVKRTPER